MAVGRFVRVARETADPPRLLSRNRSHFLFGDRVRNRALKALETIATVLPASAFFSKARVSLLFVSRLAAM
jgi:hypothetical protein